MEGIQSNVQDILKFINFERIPLAVLILIAGWLGVRFLTGFLDNLSESFTERRLLFKKISAVSRYVIYAIVLGICLSSVLELRSEALLAIAGTLGVALGFAFKDLFASLMAGVILLFDVPFQVGDRVTFGRYYGEITQIGIRSTRLRTLDDNTVTIPNSAFLTEAVANANYGALDCMVVIPFYIDPGQDFARARQIVAEAAATSRYIYLDKPIEILVSDEYVGFQLNNVIRVKAYVFDARYEKAFASDVTERGKSALREAGIQKTAEPAADAPRAEGA